MAGKGKKYLKKREKNDLPVFDSDCDFLKFFESDDDTAETTGEQSMSASGEDTMNKHGMPLLDNFAPDPDSGLDSDQEDFSKLLEASFRKGNFRLKKKKTPMPVKKRIKRYPPVEVELDLHGHTTIGAQVKTRSFIHSCRRQGYFTLRLIVGKGLHSDLGPVLPDVVEDVLQDMKKHNLIIWYEWDKKKKSKSGAIIVYLKQFDRYG